MKLSQLIRKKPTSQSNGRRRFTGVDMAVVKHDEAVTNSQANRGENVRTNDRYIEDCGYSVEGCFIHGSWKPEVPRPGTPDGHIKTVATQVLDGNPKGSIRTLAELTAKKVYADLDGMSPLARKLVLATATSAVKQARYRRRTRNYAVEAA